MKFERSLRKKPTLKERCFYTWSIPFFMIKDNFKSKNKTLKENSNIVKEKVLDGILLVNVLTSILKIIKIKRGSINRTT